MPNRGARRSQVKRGSSAWFIMTSSSSASNTLTAQSSYGVDELRVGAVGVELVEDERREQSHVAGHLLHPPQLAFLLRVGKLDH